MNEESSHQLRFPSQAGDGLAIVTVRLHRTAMRAGVFSRVADQVLILVFRTVGLPGVENRDIHNARNHLA